MLLGVSCMANFVGELAERPLRAHRRKLENQARCSKHARGMLSSECSTGWDVVSSRSGCSFPPCLDIGVGGKPSESHVGPLVTAAAHTHTHAHAHARARARARTQLLTHARTHALDSAVFLQVVPSSHYKYPGDQPVRRFARGERAVGARELWAVPATRPPACSI